MSNHFMRFKIWLFLSGIVGAQNCPNCGSFMRPVSGNWPGRAQKQRNRDHWKVCER